MTLGRASLYSQLVIQLTYQMPRTSDKRERLVEAAGALIHRQGFNQTSLADIARESEVPLGNVYYYFKTKEELAKAVIAGRRAQIDALQEHCEQQCDDPRGQLRCMLEVLRGQAEAVAEHGCPIGSLCQELNKAPSELSDQADSLLRRQLQWARERLETMRVPDAASLARHFIASLQGGALISHSLHDPEAVNEQVDRLLKILDGLA